MYWNIRCSHCSLHLRLRVEDTDFGKTVEILCPKCGGVTTTTIGGDYEEKEESETELQRKMRKIVDEILNNPEIERVIDSIYDDGFVILLNFDFCKIKEPRRNEPEKAGSFTEQDREFFKKLKIKF